MALTPSAGGQRSIGRFTEIRQCRDERFCAVGMIQICFDQISPMLGLSTADKNIYFVTPADRETMQPLTTTGGE
jgi:hypothetical protein